ncbi:MAG: tetratricopeptide repeat protein [Proteobacteria bacterium]|nr:tetratricopeptide repeat protein [Pseudomonadota bacterium]
MAYTKAGDLDRAIADLSSALELEPNDDELLIARGKAYELKGDMDHAIVDNKAATSTGRSGIMSWLALGGAYSRSKHYDLAIEAYSQCLLRQPGNGSWYHIRGDLYVEVGDFERALADFGAAISLLLIWNSDVADEVAAERAIVLSLMLRSQAGLDEVNALIAKHPDEVDAYRARAIIYLRMKRFDEAITDFDRGLAINDDRRADLLFGRGVAKLHKGDATESSSDLRQARQLVPDIDERMKRYRLPQ